MKSIKWRNRLTESYIFDLGNLVFGKLNHLTLFYLFKKIIGEYKEYSQIEDKCANIVRQLDEKTFPDRLIGEFRKKEFPFYENAKVWKRKSDEWTIEAKNSPYVIKKEGQNLKICRENYFFVDTWVLVHLVLAIVIFALWSSIQNPIFGVVFIAVGIYRVYEYFIYQTHTVLFVLEKTKRKARVTRREKTPPIILNPYRILILSILGYVNVIIWFAVFYRYIEHAFIKPLNWFSSLNYSFFTMTNFGHTNNVLPYPYGIISLIQSAMGLFLIILIIANFVSSLPKPDYYD